MLSGCDLEIMPAAGRFYAGTGVNAYWTYGAAHIHPLTEMDLV